ncbi:MAG: hypothetical protein SCK28_02715 [Bacillota bacterium]|nr:hypothetical protein [Bacillota bacterium]
MVVKVRLHSPFSQIIGKEQLELAFDKDKVTIKTLVTRLMQEYPEIKTVLPTILDEHRVYGNLLPVRDNKVILIEDEIFDQDVITVFGSISGG